MVRKSNIQILQFGTEMKKIFKEVGAGRRFIADYLDCSVDTIDSWCCGRSRISPEHLYALCTMLSTKYGVTNERIEELNRKALESYGLSPMWPPKKQTLSGLTVCLFGSLSQRKDLVAIRIISDYFGQMNQKVLICNCLNNVNMILPILDMVEQLGLSNLVLCGLSMPLHIMTLILDKMDIQHIPVIVMASDCPEDIINLHKNAYVLKWSDYDLAYKAVSLLIAEGHTKIGTVHLTKHEDCFYGYQEALKTNKIQFNPALVLHSAMNDIPLGYENVADPGFMDNLEHFLLTEEMTAVFAPTVLVSYAIPILLAKNAIKLYDDISFCGLAYPGWIGEGLNMPLTYLSYPIQEITSKALDFLTRISMGNISPQENHFIDVTNLAKVVNKGKHGSIKSLKTK